MDIDFDLFDPMPGALGELGVTYGDGFQGVMLGKQFWRDNHPAGEPVPEAFTAIFLEGAQWVCTLLRVRSIGLLEDLRDSLESQDSEDPALTALLAAMNQVFATPSGDGENGEE